MTLSICYRKVSFLLAAMLLMLTGSLVSAQTTSFAYQGTLSDGGSPASGDYDFEFKLFDDINAGAQQGATLQQLNVTVKDGIYTVTLDFGAAVFAGADRFLEISYRQAGGGSFAILSPRQQILSVPYAIKSLNAASAEGLSAACVNCVTGSQISSVNGSTVTGTIPVASLPAGSGDYIQNTANQQPSANFNISGTGTAGTFNAVTQYNIGGNRVLSNPGNWNIFVGVGAGASNTGGSENAFFGHNAGYANTTGGNNSFFGRRAGTSNTTGSGNAFFGNWAGYSNTTGLDNSFFGNGAGGGNTTGISNSFFGRAAGAANSSGGYNSTFGYYAGVANTTGSNNAFFGSHAGRSNSTGADNAFFGAAAGYENTSGVNNAFFGTSAGRSNSTGDDNAFFGTSAGRNNTTGTSNAFFGTSAGYQNDSGSYNTFFGRNSGYDNTTGQGNAFFGKEAGFHNTAGVYNAFFGLSTGAGNTTGSNNAFFGSSAGMGNTSGFFNTFVGAIAGNANTTGNNNTIIGKSADVTSGNLSFATAIGSGATVSTSNTVVLGRSSDSVRVPGTLVALTLGTAGSTPLCRNASNQIATCSSSLRYKTDVAPFTGGLDIINRLRPITFTWRDGATRDIGFGAEEVFRAEPLLATRNDKGEIEGVKYGQMTTVLVNAVKQQQAQIEEYRKQLAAQQGELAALKQLLCRSQPKAATCQSAKRLK